jgi:hypothetical protein
MRGAFPEHFANRHLQVTHARHDIDWSICCQCLGDIECAVAVQIGEGIGRPVKCVDVTVEALRYRTKQGAHT